jgi:AraC family transcriptional regulator
MLQHRKEPEYRRTDALLVVGKRVSMSLQDDKTPALWRSFMPLRHAIAGRLDTNVYNIQRYPVPIHQLGPETIFEKWAGVVVADDATVLPDCLESLTIPAGEYLVFLHRGGPATFAETAAYIYGQWIPASEYTCDERPHFERMEESWNALDPDAEEEVWIPVRRKTR